MLVSELVANAAENAPGTRIGLALRMEVGPTGELGVTCEVTDTSFGLVQPRQAGPGDECGSGLAIITAPCHCQQRPRGIGRKDHLVHVRRRRAAGNRQPVPPGRTRARRRQLSLTD
jgi:hypothetical protein